MNQAINFFWTILSFLPVIGFWLTADLVTCYIFLGISIICLFIPAKLMQPSDRPKFYEKLGVKFIRKFVQNGEYLNKLARKSKPNHKIVNNKASALRYIKSVAMYERYHFLCFVFFLLTAVYAVVQTNYPSALVITLANIFYNICPIVLQQYNRARISKLNG